MPLAAGLVLLAWQWDGRPLLESALLGIALAMAILPEEIPVVLTVFLALGAWRLSHQKVLARRVQAVEALGGITVLAVDKTGTLTQNRMQVAELRVGRTAWRDGAGEALPEAFHELAEFAMLATPVDPFDPMEKAIRAFVRNHLRGTEHVHDGWAPEQAYALSPDILAHDARVPGEDRPQRHLLALQGRARGGGRPVPPGRRTHVRALQREVQGMAERGLRVLAVARGEWQGAQLARRASTISTFDLLGLVGLADPLRARGARRRRRLPARRHPRDHDHRRPSRHGARHRAPGRPVDRRDVHHRRRARGDGRRRARAARSAHVQICRARRAGAEAAHRQRAEGRRRGRRA